MTPEQLTTELHRLIPLTAAMQVEVVDLRPESLILQAPLDANRNHAGNAFAGSLYALASIAGWALLYQLTQRESVPAELVLADGRIRYRRPVRKTLFAQVLLPSDEQQRFLASLIGGHRTRLRLDVGVPDLEQPAALFQGLYVAVPAALPTA
mgnify:FL=1